MTIRDINFISLMDTEEGGQNGKSEGRAKGNVMGKEVKKWSISGNEMCLSAKIVSPGVTAGNSRWK